MGKLIVNSYDEFASHLGEVIGTSEWLEVIQVNNVKMLVNYGMDQMRFGQPVLSGQRVRLTASLHDIANIRGICKAQIKFKLEIENQKKQALEGLATFLYYFE